MGNPIQCYTVYKEWFELSYEIKLRKDIALDASLEHGFPERYKCKCGATTGKQNEFKVCPKCNTEVRFNAIGDIGLPEMLIVALATVVKLRKGISSKWKMENNKWGIPAFGIKIETYEGPVKFAIALEYWDKFECKEVEPEENPTISDPSDINRLLSLI